MGSMRMSPNGYVKSIWMFRRKPFGTTQRQSAQRVDIYLDILSANPVRKSAGFVRGKAIALSIRPIP